MKIPMTSTYVLVLMFPTYHVYIILYIIIHIHISICMCVLCVHVSSVCVFILPGGKELSIAQRSTWHRVPALCPLFAGHFHQTDMMHDISARS